MERPFYPLGVALLTVSDSRDEKSDRSGQFFVDRLAEEGHQLVARRIVVDDKYCLRACLSQWAIDPAVQAILVTGGTGVAARDVTPEAVKPLLDLELEGFGELFRHVSYAEIGTATMQSRALAGMINRRAIFCVPGSTPACKTAWNNILRAQLDIRTRPCSIVQMIID